MVSRLLKVIPLGIGAFAMAAAAALLMANLILPALHRGGIKISKSLIGVTAPAKPRLTWQGLLNGTFQAAYASEIGTKMPLYADAVRLRDQAELSLFGVSATASVVVGQGTALFEAAYAEEYCARSIAAWRPGAERWAIRLREIQDIEMRRGRAFLYVLTPSKVSHDPAILPPGYTCPASQADRAGTVPVWLGLLRDAGVHVVDTTAVMREAEGAYPFRMFPRGGSHWNAVGAALSEQAVLAGLNDVAPGRGFEPFTFQWHMQKHPTGVDIDIANLMNLIRPFRYDPVPATEIQPAVGVTCPGTKVVIIGGSFSHAMLEHLSRGSCEHGAIEYEYWRAYTVRWSADMVVAQRGVDEAARDAAILAADVLVYEENEQVMPNPLHGAALYEFMHDRVSATP